MYCCACWHVRFPPFNGPVTICPWNSMTLGRESGPNVTARFWPAASAQLGPWGIDSSVSSWAKSKHPDAAVTFDWPVSSWSGENDLTAPVVAADQDGTVWPGPAAPIDIWIGRGILNPSGWTDPKGVDDLGRFADPTTPFPSKKYIRFSHQLL